MKNLAILIDQGLGAVSPKPDPVLASQWAMKALTSNDDEAFNARWTFGRGSGSSCCTPAFKRELQLKLKAAGHYNGEIGDVLTPEALTAIEALSN